MVLTFCNILGECLSEVLHVLMVLSLHLSVVIYLIDSEIHISALSGGGVKH